MMRFVNKGKRFNEWNFKMSYLFFFVEVASSGKNIGCLLIYILEYVTIGLCYVIKFMVLLNSFAWVFFVVKH